MAKRTYKSKSKAFRKSIPKKPKGEAKIQREEIIKKKLAPLKGKEFINTDTGKKIGVTGKGIKETAYHASKSKLSTLAAIDAKHQMRVAKDKGKVPKKDTRRQKDMKIDEMHKFEGRYKGHKTKVMIGHTEYGKNVLYSITAK